MLRFRSGLVLIVAALSWNGAPAQAPDCALPKLCFWVDDDTCGRCLDSNDNPTATTCTGVDSACLGIGNNVCGGTCANDANRSCFTDPDCNAVGGVCNMPRVGDGLDPAAGGTPYCRVQRAYDGARQTTSRDNVHILVVREGTYQECVSASGFVEDGLGLWDPNLSEDLPVEILAEDFLLNGRNDRTIIDGTLRCDGITTPAGATVSFGGTGAALTGFTIQGGTRSGVFAQGQVSITNNLIQGNQSELGGGVYLLTASCYYSQVDPISVQALIADNVIEDNSAAAPDAAVELGCQFCIAGGSVAPCGTGSGGGIFAAADDRLGCGTSDAVEIRGNTVLDNTAENINFDPCSGQCSLSGAACQEPDVPCPIDEGDCVPQLRYTASGGGIYATTNSEQNRSASVVLTQNLIAGNSIAADSTEGYGGGVYAVSFGFGTDTIEISENCVGGTDLANCTSNAFSGNSATLHGGGIAARARPLDDGRHTMNIHDNTVTGNAADRDGGGLELLTEAITLGAGLAGDFVRLSMTGNVVTDNTSGRDGGGIKAVSDIRRTTLADAAELTHSIDGNVVQNNTSFLGGAGAILIPIADADDFDTGVCGPNSAPAESRIDFARNLVADNVATAEGGLCAFSGQTCLVDANCVPSGDFCFTDGLCFFGGLACAGDEDCPDFCDPITIIGGGILTLPLTFGAATATVMIDETTVAGNTIGSNGFVAGIEAQATTEPDCLTGFDLGASRLLIDRTIVSDSLCPTSQQCIGVGGVIQGILTAVAASSSVFGHTPNYESSLFPSDPPAGNITGDPQVAAPTYFPDACSPVFAGFCHGNLAPCDVDADCSGACSIDSDNPLEACPAAACPNGTCLTRCVDAVGFYANPDSTGDGAVDGQEILGIAASFGAEEGTDNRFDPAYDINHNGSNDGVDLSFFTTEFGEICEP